MVQCRAQTIKKRRCRNHAKKDMEKCHVHLTAEIKYPMQKKPSSPLDKLAGPQLQIWPDGYNQHKETTRPGPQGRQEAFQQNNWSHVEMEKENMVAQPIQRNKVKFQIETKTPRTPAGNVTQPQPVNRRPYEGNERYYEYNQRMETTRPGPQRRQEAFQQNNWSHVEMEKENMVAQPIQRNKVKFQIETKTPRTPAGNVTQPQPVNRRPYEGNERYYEYNQRMETTRPGPQRRQEAFQHNNWSHVEMEKENMVAQPIQRNKVKFQIETKTPRTPAGNVTQPQPVNRRTYEGNERYYEYRERMETTKSVRESPNKFQNVVLKETGTGNLTTQSSQRIKMESPMEEKTITTKKPTAPAENPVQPQAQISRDSDGHRPDWYIEQMETKRIQLEGRQEALRRRYTDLLHRETERVNYTTKLRQRSKSAPPPRQHESVVAALQRELRQELEKSSLDYYRELVAIRKAQVEAHRETLRQKRLLLMAHEWEKQLGQVHRCRQVIMDKKLAFNAPQTHRWWAA